MTNYTVGSNGLRLSLSVNSTQLGVGQSLQVNVSLSNSLLNEINIPTINNWLFAGVPISMWPDCFYSNPIGTQLFTPDAEIVVLKGHYSLGNITMAAPKLATNSSLIDLCHEFRTVGSVMLRPNSTKADLNQFNGITGTNESFATDYLVNNFVTNGYWNFTSNGGTNSSVPQYPAIISYYGNAAPLPRTNPFIPGSYTVAVTDEWGQAVLLHFEVDYSKIIAQTSNSVTVQSANNLTLTMSINQTSTQVGHGLTISVDERNTLQQTNNVSGAYNWPIVNPAVNARLGGSSIFTTGPCRGEYPMGWAITKGYYTVSNMTMAEWLGLYDSDAYHCGIGVGGGVPYVFQSSSDLAQIGQVSPQATGMFAFGSFSGYWMGEGIYVNFSPGVYTVVAGDEWGAIAFLYFTVT